MGLCIVLAFGLIILGSQFSFIKSLYTFGSFLIVIIIVVGQIHLYELYYSLKYPSFDTIGNVNNFSINKNNQNNIYNTNKNNQKNDKQNNNGPILSLSLLYVIHSRDNNNNSQKTTKLSQNDERTLLFSDKTKNIINYKNNNNSSTYTFGPKLINPIIKDQQSKNFIKKTKPKKKNYRNSRNYHKTKIKTSTIKLKMKKHSKRDKTKSTLLNGNNDNF